MTEDSSQFGQFPTPLDHQPIQVTEGHSTLLWQNPKEDPHNHWFSFAVAMIVSAAIVGVTIALTSQQHLNIFIG